MGVFPGIFLRPMEPSVNKVIGLILNGQPAQVRAVDPVNAPAGAWQMRAADPASPPVSGSDAAADAPPAVIGPQGF
jgi:hypothetical protein